MKAEHRHELQQNALATKIIQLPNYGRIWLRRGLTVLAVIIVIALIVLMQLNGAARRRADSQQALAQAIQEAQILRTRGPGSLSQPLDLQFLTTMGGYYDTVRHELDLVDSQSKDKAELSQALLVRGDINLFMATLPPPSHLASTQPTVTVTVGPTADEAYKEAKAAYGKVLEQYSDQHMNMLAARLGLAAVAENQGDSKAARDQYQAVADDASAPMIYLAQAKSKLASLNKPTSQPMIADNVIAPLINPSLLLPQGSFNNLLPSQTPSAPTSTTAPTAIVPAVPAATTKPK